MEFVFLNWKKVNEGDQFHYKQNIQETSRKFFYFKESNY